MIQPYRFGVGRGVLLPVILAMGLLPSPASAQGAAQTVKVLQTNIHRDIGGSDSVASAQPSLAKEINYLNPDVWTLQELGGNNVSYNAATAKNDLVSFISQDVTIFGANPQVGVNYFVYLSADNDGYDTTAIVSRYAFSGTQTFSDAGGGFSALRGLAMANVAVPGTNGLAVFTAHLKANSSSSEAEQRQAEADADSASVKNWMSAHGTEGVVVTGDFNESEDANDADNWSGGGIGGALPNGETYHPITTLKSAGLADPKPLSAGGKSDTISSAETGSSPLDSRFDYTLYGGSVLQYLSGTVFDTKQLSSAGQLPAGFVAGDSASASDHLPVLSVFQLAAAPEPGGGAVLLLGASALGLLRLRRSRR